MFPLNNFGGSCWINACLQLVFRIPEVQTRYNSKEFDKDNVFDVCLCRLWNSKGSEGLKELFDAICVSQKNISDMPAGRGTGDSHELFIFLCDKLPYLDKICRFKVAHEIKCSNCTYKNLEEHSVIEFEIEPSNTNVSLSSCISEIVKPLELADWKCDEGCQNRGCTKQQLIGSFPKIMLFHKDSIGGSIEYPSVLSLNKNDYALVGVTCWNGGHWWSYGRNLPPGSSWYTLDDTKISEHGPKQFPISSNMRLLIYYRLEN
jgi:uncharacterized UBP type Zn finger protein